MLKILQKDGYPVGERELSRLRKKHGLQMRAASEKTTTVASKKRKRSEVDDSLGSQLEAAASNEASLPDVGPDSESPQADAGAEAEDAPTLPPEVHEKRQKHLEALQAESDHRYRTKTRRRRTRPWAGLPADPPGPPRFPSETTIDEAKQILNMSHTIYPSLREQCQAICEREDVRKKTDAGVEKWRFVQERLVTENEHLSNVFYENHDSDHKQLWLAVEVICADVTKRMRTSDNRLTIQECKNILGVNPEEARQLRKAFEDILRKDSFVSKLEAGQEHWEGLKAHWIAGSQHLQRLVEHGPTDAEYANKTKAMELLCRDVMKRLRDENAKKDPLRLRTKEKDITTSTITTMAKKAKQSAAPKENITASTPIEGNAGATTLATQALAAAPANGYFQTQQVPFHYGNLQIDPKLLLAASIPLLAHPG